MGVSLGRDAGKERRPSELSMGSRSVGGEDRPDLPRWGQGVSHSGSQPNGMAGRPLPGWVTSCSVKHRINPMTTTRITLATLAMAHLFEHFLQAMLTPFGHCLPAPHGPESLKGPQLGLGGRQELPAAPNSLLGQGSSSAWSVQAGSSSSLPPLLLFPHPPRILTGQAENPAIPDTTFEHTEKQQRMLARAPTPLPIHPVWELRNHRSRPPFPGHLQQVSCLLWSWFPPY